MAALSASVRANRPLAAVVRAMHAIAPLHLADKSWDNVGLLLEAPKPRTSNGVFLAIDLTLDVADELLSEKNKGVSVAVIYHPTIFRGLKSLTLANTQQQSLLRCAAEGISIYCPHTSLDAAPGGINDWLAFNVLQAAAQGTSTASSTKSISDHLASLGVGDVWQRSMDNFASSLFSDTSSVTPLQSSTNASSDEARRDGWSSAGMGRKMVLPQPVSLAAFIGAFKAATGLPGAQLAYARGGNEQTQIRSVAVCAGSGGSVLQGAQADLWITGELSHHELLATTEPGRTSVLLLRHSASERGYLADVLAPRLRALLPRHDEQGSASWNVIVSENDHDPLNFV